VQAQPNPTTPQEVHHDKIPRPSKDAGPSAESLFRALAETQSTPGKFAVSLVGALNLFMAINQKINFYAVIYDIFLDLILRKEYISPY
jgi:hypothetical protein